MSQKIPLQISPADFDEHSPFLVHNKNEIIHNLRLLSKKPELVAVYFDNSAEFGLSAVLEVIPDTGTLLLDVPNDEVAAHKVAQALKLVCVTQHNKVKIQFTCNRVVPIQFAGKAALATDLPQQLMRLQRREYYRLTVPLSIPLVCYIPTADGEVVEVSLVDISLGGVGIIGYPPDIALEPGRTYQNCRIELPETGTIVVDLAIKSAFDITLKNGIRTRRSGCEFTRIPGTMQNLIQRYINRVERERLNKSS